MKPNIPADLRVRRNELRALIRRTEQQIRSAPPGYLCVSKSRSRPAQYYHVSHQENGQRTRRYLSKKEDLKTIQDLAQKDYDLKVLKAAKQELAAIERFLELVPQITLEKMYDELPAPKKPHVRPLVEPFAVFAAKWQNREYDGNPVPIAKPFQTARGEIVRSKSEVEIANFLYYHHIPYLYECPLVLNDRGRRVIFYPDFTILDPVTREVVYLEHLGRMDDPEYVNDNLRKRRVYEENGFFEGEKIFYTWETYDQPLTRRQVERVVRHAVHMPEE